MLDPSVQTSLAILDLIRAGQFAQIRDQFAPSLRALVTAEALESAWSAALGRYGPVTSVGAPISEPAQAGVAVVKAPLTFEHGALTLVVSVSAAGQLTGLQLAPAEAARPVAPWEPPAYADPETFEEQDLTVGAGSLAVPGTLSLPHGPGPYPAVVLLAGSGPQDRDETFGRNKPLKDLAWGLASHGAAVLRFDKVTYAHPDAARAAAAFTVADEYAPHAAAAIQLLREQAAVDAERVFLLGHSLGGTVAPRIAAIEPSVAGLVILAGGAQPLHWAAVRQVRYLASLDAAMAAASESAVGALTEQARRVDSPELSPVTPAGTLPFGVPAPYWLDLRGYDPVAAAAALGKPLLIVQGGRDYQSTVADDLARWRDGLADRPGVTIRVYPHDNHLFFPGSGPSSPAEYEPAQHMDPAVVADIANWIATIGRSPAQPARR